MTSKKKDIILETFLDINLKSVARVPIIAVYNNPTDYPGKFVARLWDIGNVPTRLVMVKNGLEKIRSNIPTELERLAPSSLDDPVLVETWC